MKLSILIPVYNEIQTIQEVLKRVQAVTINDEKNQPINKEIILIDDMSTDGTREYLQNLPINNEFKIIYHNINQGKGEALRSGIKSATGDFAVFQDADLEYDPQDLSLLVKATIEQKVNVVHGNRFTKMKKNMYRLHTIGNLLITSLANVLYGNSLRDINTCYKLIRMDILKSLNLKSDRFNTDLEVTLKILKKGIKIIEIPISYSGRDFSKGKKITWKDGFGQIATLIKYRFSD